MPRKKKKSNDFILIFSAVALLALSAAAILFFATQKPPAVVTDADMEIIGKITFTIDFNNGKKRVFEGAVVAGESLADILSQSAKAGDFSFKLDGKANVAAIGTLAARGGRFWRWYQNGERVANPQKVSLKAGDLILLKYE